MLLSEVRRVPVDEDLSWSSDVAVTQAAWRYEPGAREILQARHGSSARLAAGFVPGAEPAPAFTAVFDHMSSATAQFVPFRLAWLSEIAGTALPLTEQDDEIWAAFLSLSPSWQSAVWHRCVDGDSAASLSRTLGLDEESAARATVTARASMTRRVAHAYPAGAAPACREIHEHLTTDISPSLGARFTRTLREHARHCDDCLPMLRDILRLEHTLREALAGRVLGPYAAAYLASRPFVAPARLVSTSRGSFALSRRAVRPLVGLATLGATATAIASVVSISVSSPGSAQAESQIAAVQVVSGPHQLDRLPAGSTSIVLTSPRAVEGDSSAGAGSPGSASNAVGDESPSEATDPGSNPAPGTTSPGDTVTLPATPPASDGVKAPSDDSGDSSGGPKSTDTQVSVGVSNGSVAVTVVPPVPVVPPVTVTTPPLPVVADLPALPPIEVGGIGVNLNGGPSASQELGTRALGIK